MIRIFCDDELRMSCARERHNIRGFSRAITSADVDVKGVMPDDIDSIDLAEI